MPFLLLLFILPFPGTVALRLSCLAAAFAIAAFLWKKAKPPPFPCKAVLAVWIGVAFVSLLFAVDARYSLGEIKNEIGYAMMALFAFFVVSRDERRVLQGSLAIVLSIAVISTWSLWFQLHLGYWKEDAGHGGVAAFTGLLLMALPALFILWQRQRRVRPFLLLVAVLALLAGAYGLQRMLWVALGIEIGVLVMLLLFKGSMGMSCRRAMIILTATVISVALLLLVAQTTRVVVSGPEVEIKNDVRLRQWTAVMVRILDQPMIGAGFGRNAMKLGNPDLVKSDAMFWHAHNLFLNYGLAMGLPGMIALMSVFGGLLLQYWRMYRSPNQTLTVLGIAGLLLVIGVLLRNFSNDMFQRDSALLFWSMNGLLLGCGLRLSWNDDQTQK